MFTRDDADEFVDGALTFDRVFISVVLFVAIHLLKMRFLEAYLPLWIATILTLVLAVIIVRRG